MQRVLADNVIQAGKGKAQLKDEQAKEPSLSEKLIQIGTFIQEVMIEFKKISWPTRAQVLQETWSVLFLVAVITLLVLGFDWILSNWVFSPIEHWTRIHGGVIGK